MRLIDADALRKSIEKDTCPVSISYFYRKMREAPTIDAAPVVHGHWKEKRKYEVGAAVDDDGWLELEELCSVCGKWVKTQWRSPLYCPNCGAKMDEVSE